jgi:hypothetical protein
MQQGARDDGCPEARPHAPEEPRLRPTCARGAFLNEPRDIATGEISAQTYNSPLIYSFNEGLTLEFPRKCACSVVTKSINQQADKEAIAIRADEYEVLWEAARSCVWLGTYGPEDQRKDYVTQGLWWAEEVRKAAEPLV